MQNIKLEIARREGKRGFFVSGCCKNHEVVVFLPSQNWQAYYPKQEMAKYVLRLFPSYHAFEVGKKYNKL